MNIKVRNFDLELTLILARVYKYLKINSGISIDILNTKFSKLDMSFYPILALLAAQCSKGLSKKNRTLAVASQVLFLSTEIHNQIPENAGKNQFAKQIQLPILVGDLLFSRFYEILCKEDCIEYLNHYLDYIANLNHKWVDYLEQKIDIEELSANCYGELASLVMELNMNINSNTNYWTKIVKRYGYAMGNLYGAYKLNLGQKEIIKYWDMVLETIDLMPGGEIKDSFSQFAQELYYNLFQNLIPENRVPLSCVAEK
ncbi:MAG: hypothetical protein GXW85_11195 [Clostridia bacterium]|nr:hypothetical protein [Clostridia bacterium]